MMNQLVLSNKDVAIGLRNIASELSKVASMISDEDAAGDCRNASMLVMEVAKRIAYSAVQEVMEDEVYGREDGSLGEERLVGQGG